MSLYLIAPATDEPVRLAEAKDMLRIDGTDLDADLAVALVAARLEAEHYAGRSFAPQQWRLNLRDWWLGGLALPRGPVESLESVSYLDPASVWQSADVDDFVLDGGDLFIPCDYDPPRTSNRDASIRIVYSTGTWHPDSNGSNLPAAIKRAIIMLAQSTFDSLSEQPQTLRERAFALLRPYRHDAGMVAA